MANDLPVHGFSGDRFCFIGMSNTMLLVALAAFAIAVMVAGCAQTDVVAERKKIEIYDGGDDFGDIDCSGRGPLISVGDSIVDADDCETSDPQLAFRYALCVCTDYPSGAELTTYAFDSSKIDTEPSRGGGSVGINENLQNGGFATNINGSLRVAGNRGVSVSDGGEIRVGQDLEVQSGLEGNNVAVTVGGDARIGGDVRIDNFSVNGTLSMPSDAELLVSEPPRTGPDREEAIQVNPPCACGEEIKDIPSLVAQASEDNDNASLDFDINKELENYTGPITTKELPCGRYYLSSLKGTGPLVLRITGRVALYVTEHVNFQDTVEVKLDPGAEFDLYLADSMVASKNLIFGDADNSGRTRLFVGNASADENLGTLDLQGTNLFSGQIYAPRLELVVSGETRVYGSVFVRRVQLNAPLTIYYDRNPIETGPVCSD